VEGFTDDHLAALQQHGTERVLIAYDRDAAGDGAADKLATRLMGCGTGPSPNPLPEGEGLQRIECFRIQFPKGMDANDYGLKMGPADKSLGLVIRKAVWLGKGPAPRIETGAAASPVSGATPPVPTPVLPDPPQSFPPLAAQPLQVEAVAPSSHAESELAEPALPASPLPPSPAPDIPAEVKDDEVVMVFGERRYRVRGLIKNLGVESLKVNVLVSLGEAFHVDSFDLYAAKARAQYVAQAAAELRLKDEIVKTDLGRLLLNLEALQDARRQRALTPQPPAARAMSAEDRQAALAWLQSPALMDRLLTDFETMGLVGETVNKQVAYLATVSRKLERPLGVVIQSSSAAGKTSLLDAVLALVPDEDRVKYSAMTGQSLYYLGETHMKHKVLAIVEEEGVSRASYALKLLQSEGELTMASTAKDPVTGNLITQTYRVEGPVALLLTTTARDLDEELLNRCLVLAVDEGRAQTRAIHRLQRDRRTLEGLIARREREALIHLHQNVQRLLRPLDVLNPYARFLTFPDQTTRLRRDHEKYLTLIDAIALLHQHQRPVKRAGSLEYLEVSLDDIATANQLAHEVLGRSLDELPPQTRRLLRLIDGYAAAECARQQIKRQDVRFSRRQLREALSLGDTQLKVHLTRLVELEYLLAHRTKTGGFEYELVYEIGADDGALRCPGLIDVEALQRAYDTARSGSKESRAVHGRAEVGTESAPSRPEEIAGEPGTARSSDPSLPLVAKTPNEAPPQTDEAWGRAPRCRCGRVTMPALDRRAIGP
jgi:hypothetical protein